MKNRCFYLDAAHRLSLAEEEIPVPLPGEAVVRIMANGICGSDVHFFKEGRLGNFLVKEAYVPGHECSGVVTAVGANALGVRAGDKVTIEPGIPCGRCGSCKTGRYNLCPHVRFLSEPGINGTFCDYVAVRADMLHLLPEDMGFDTGALAEPAAVAVHAMNLAGNVSGRTAAILGAGPIGLITLMAFKAAGGARAICVDINEARLACASSMGADETILNKDCKLTNICDIAFETAGSPVTTAQLFAAVRPGGRAVQVGWPSGNIVPMDIAGLMEKEITYSGLNRYANAYPAAIAWLADGRIDGRKLITHRFPFARTPEAFEFTAANPNLVIKTIVSNQ